MKDGGQGVRRAELGDLRHEVCGEGRRGEVGGELDEEGEGLVGGLGCQGVVRIGQG